MSSSGGTSLPRRAVGLSRSDAARKAVAAFVAAVAVPEDDSAPGARQPTEAQQALRRPAHAEP
jgi:hypothetical protein